MVELKITNDPLNVSLCMAMTADTTCGGMVIFVGHVRDNTKGKKVLRLEFECYQSMALKELAKITDEAMRLWPVKNVVIHHRTGIVNIGEEAVVIVVNSMHRDAAFKACQYIIDMLKQTVPIWKKEVFEGGDQWVSAYP